MPEIRITDDQLARLAEVQDDLEREVVGKYGQVRPQDALEYLLDQYDGVAVDGSGAASEPSAATDDGARTRIVGAADDATDDEDVTSETSGDDHVEHTSEDAADETPADETPAAATTSTTTVSRVETPAGAKSGDADDGGSAMLDDVMNLLSVHDDKWDHSETADERYVVELPDGTSEPARTKDDVRALLFRHYR